MDHPKILSLPDELLIDIFNAVREDGLQTKLSPTDVHHCHATHRGGGSGRDIANVRLTCRRFAATSAHLLVPSVHLPDLSSASLARLEAIAQHPHIGKGVRTVRLSTCFYTPRLATDFQSFAWYAINRVFDAAVRCQEDIQAERRRAEEAGLPISAPLFKRWMGRIAALEDVMEVLKSWSQMTGTGGSEVVPSPSFPPASAAIPPRVCDDNDEKRHVRLLRIAHALYQSRYRDQEVLLAGGGFVERIAQAMAKMPRAKVLEVLDFNHQGRKCPTCQPSSSSSPPTPPLGEGDEEEEADLYDSLLHIESFIQPSSWEEALTHRWSTTPPVEILYQLPVALQQAQVTLDRIAYSTGVNTTDYYPLLAQANHNNPQDLLNLRAAVRALGIKSFAFLQADEISRQTFAPPQPPRAQDVHALKNLIKAMASSDRLERLRIRLGGAWANGALDPDHEHNLGDLLWPSSSAPLRHDYHHHHRTTTEPIWGRHLRDISITGIPFTLADLTHLATALQATGAVLDFLSLSRVCLVSGSWASALDTLRAIPVTCEKSLFAPSGAECDDVSMTMTTDRYERIFCAEPLRGGGSVAECFINGDQSVRRNPLRCGWKVVDFVYTYSVEGDEVVVQVVRSGEGDSDDDDDDDDDDDESDESDELEEIEDDEDAEGGEEVDCVVKGGTEGPVVIVGEVDLSEDDHDIEGTDDYLPSLFCRAHT